ncbi:MAG: DUF202 domain-containing protein [Nitrospirae bacterium]|nr:DUF202 domain-containing protein [Nitrospirota bacterium]
MPDGPEINRPPRIRNRRVHMANERTFLAWIRTSIGIMAFGFVVERFALFLRQFLILTGGGIAAAAPSPSLGLASVFGIILVGLGAFMGVLSFVRFKKDERQIDEDTYRPSLILDILLILTVLSIAAFLIGYLLHLS